MNATLESSFELFARRISLSQHELDNALGRAKEICQFLSQNAAIEEFRITGSIARLTAIQGFSDVDIVATLASSSSIPATPCSIAVRLLNTLRPRYREARISENTVRIRFTQGPDVDVIPALLDTVTIKGQTIYRIPSADRLRWDTYAPEQQNVQINQRSALLGSNFIHMIKIIKWWSKQHGQPLASYEIENIASATFAYRMPPITRAIVEFLEIAEHSPEGRQEGHSNSISEARDTANKALKCEQQGDTRGALVHWGRLLGDQFSSVIT
ncbi:MULTISPECIES: SMODS domain-containing nucleotidyltransferase [unclassified Streptomyces]|uniref:SMODS domain-containing nucleotidyltransferase n=1 Tax=unclassified Streptomyces TaxID=2593676 RepID=UPI0033275437